MNATGLKKKILLAVLICIYTDFACCQIFTKDNFRNPPICYWPRPLWFWNNTTVTPEGITDQMVALRDRCGYGGFGVIPFGKNFSPEYLSGDYLKLNGIMLEKARELGLAVCLYDEYGFPSGSEPETLSFSFLDNENRQELTFLNMRRYL